MTELLINLLADETAQDVVEYALLTAGIGLAGAAAWPLVVGAIGATYEQFNGLQEGLWEPPPPSQHP